MNRVNEAQKDINDFLAKNAKDLQQKYNEKCRQKLYEIRTKIQSFCDGSVIPPALMTEEAASEAAQPAEVLSNAAQAPPEQSLVPKAHPPTPSQPPAGTRMSVVSGALSTNDQELNDLYHDFIMSVRQATGILKGIQHIIDSYLSVKGYNRNDTIKVLIENFNKAIGIIMKSADIMNTRFMSDYRFEHMVAELQKVIRYYIDTDNKYRAELKYDSDAHPPSVQNLLLLQTQPVGPSVVAAQDLISRGDGMRQKSVSPQVSSQVAEPSLSRASAQDSIASPQTSEVAQQPQEFLNEDGPILNELHRSLGYIWERIDQNLNSHSSEELSTLLQNADSILKKIYDVIVKYSKDGNVYGNLIKEDYNPEKRQYEKYVAEYNRMFPKQGAPAAEVHARVHSTPSESLPDASNSGSSFKAFSPAPAHTFVQSVSHSPGPADGMSGFAALNHYSAAKQTRRSVSPTFGSSGAAAAPDQILPRSRLTTAVVQGAQAAPYVSRNPSPGRVSSARGNANEYEISVSPTFSQRNAAVQRAVEAPIQGYKRTNNELVFDFDTKSDLKKLKIPQIRDNEYVVNQTMANKNLKEKAQNIRDSIDTAVDNFNKNHDEKMKVKKIDIGDGNGRVAYSIDNTYEHNADYNNLLVTLENLAGGLFETLSFLKDGRSKLIDYIRKNYPERANEIIETTANEVLMGGSHRSTHLAKYKNKNKNKTRNKYNNNHNHNHNHKARPGRKNKKTIKKYRGMSRMPVMPRMQKQNVVVYRKHKKTTRKYKATRHAKMNKNKPKNSNKKSRKFRR